MTSASSNIQSMPDLWQEETVLFSQGFRHVAGVDEAGRGPLAGPVVASCVVSSMEIDIPGVKDSKQCSEKNRQRLSKDIRKHPDLHVGIGIVSPEEIDTINILKASLLAFKRAVEDCAVPVEYLLVDGLQINPAINISQKPLVKGDSRSFLIAAASIVAKVERDGIMMAMHEKWPVYGFNKHKGYPTKSHLAALDQFGICAIHRKSYAPVRNRISGKLAF